MEQPRVFETELDIFLSAYLSRTRFTMVQRVGTAVYPVMQELQVVEMKIGPTRRGSGATTGRGRIIDAWGACGCNARLWR